MLCQVIRRRPLSNTWGWGVVWCILGGPLRRSPSVWFMACPSNQSKIVFEEGQHSANFSAY